MKIEDVLNKYETKIKIENIGTELRNMSLNQIPEDKLTIKDVQKPKHEKKEEYDIYTYNIKDYTLEIKFKENNYRTMQVTLKKPTPEEVPEPYYMWNWDYKGMRGKIY